jgi:hypothetical protein
MAMGSLSPKIDLTSTSSCIAMESSCSRFSFSSQAIGRDSTENLRASEYDANPVRCPVSFPALQCSVMCSLCLHGCFVKFSNLTLDEVNGAKLIAFLLCRSHYNPSSHNFLRIANADFAIHTVVCSIESHACNLDGASWPPPKRNEAPLGPIAPPDNSINLVGWSTIIRPYIAGSNDGEVGLAVVSKMPTSTKGPRSPKHWAFSRCSVNRNLLG